MDTHAFANISLILAAAFMSGLFLRRLRQPALVGYILVGIILGPGVLGLVHTTEMITWLAELGIILLMFMIGLELDMHSFRKSLSKSLMIVAIQVSLAIAAVFTLTFFFAASIGFAVLIGSIIALSSTAVAITVLKDLRQEHTESGTVTTSVLIAQDLAVVPILILVQMVGGESITSGHLIRATLSLILVGVTLFGIFYLTHHPRFLRKLQNVFSHGVDQPVLAALALIFTAAALSGYAGLSSAYGAFALGLIIRNIGDIGEAYKNAISPLHDLLLMIFFLSVGILIDVQLVIENWILISTLLLIVIALKTLGNTLILMVTSLSWRGRLLAAAAISQIGEFSFVLLGVGSENNLVSSTQYQVVLAVIALSLVISPVWVTIVRKITGIPSLSNFIEPRYSPLLVSLKKTLTDERSRKH